MLTVCHAVNDRFMKVADPEVIGDFGQRLMTANMDERTVPQAIEQSLHDTPVHELGTLTEKMARGVCESGLGVRVDKIYCVAVSSQG